LVSKLVINCFDLQDTRPTKASRGTVVAIHGSPGSHKDFKYVTPLLREKDIRTVAINWPGMGYSECGFKFITPFQ